MQKNKDHSHQIPVVLKINTPQLDMEINHVNMERKKMLCVRVSVACPRATVIVSLYKMFSKFYKRFVVPYFLLRAIVFVCERLFQCSYE